MYRLLEPEKGEVLARMQAFYPTLFYEKVASSKLMDEFYDSVVKVAGIATMIRESKEPIVIVDIAGGRRFKDAIEKVAKKGFVYASVDISREQLGGGEGPGKESGRVGVLRDILHLNRIERGEKSRIVGDMSNLPISNADVAALLNPPNAAFGFSFYFNKRYFGKYEKYLGLERSFFEKEVTEKETARIENLDEYKIYGLLIGICNSIDRLNILEAARVIRKNGVLATGSFVQPISGYTDHHMIGEMKVPLMLKRYEEFNLDPKVLANWKEYGSDFERSHFFAGAYIKTGEIMEEVFKECVRTFQSNFDELLGIKKFWKILRDMEEARARENAAAEIQKAAKKSVNGSQ